MKILVTGGSGFVGRNLIPKLMEKGHVVVNMDLVESDDDFVKSKVKTLLVDIRDSDAVKKAFDGGLKDFDVVIHLAALSRENKSNEVPDEYFDTNITGTYNVVRMVKGSNVKKFIFASSFLAYGNQPTETVKEDQPLFPSTVYAATKVTGEALIRSFSEQFGFDFVFFRKCNIYGHKDPQKRVIDILLERARSNKDITLFGNKTLDFVDINDVVDAYCAAVDYKGSNVFVIGSGKGNHLRELAEFIVKSVGSKSKISEAPAAKGDLMRFVADISRAKKLLGYNPRGELYKFVKEKIENA